MRVHPEPIGHAPAPRSPVVQPAGPPTILFAVRELDRSLYSGDSFTRLFAYTTADAVRNIGVRAPRLVVVDWDDASLEGPEICEASRALATTSILVTTADVTEVPAILRSGSHAVLLKPFAPILLAARMGRLLRETAFALSRSPAAPEWQIGTNRVWPDTSCPQCGAPGATSFDFASHRRMWYACLSCDTTWIGRRQE